MTAGRVLIFCDFFTQSSDFSGLLPVGILTGNTQWENTLKIFGLRKTANVDQSGLNNICGMPISRDFIKQVFFTIDRVLHSPSKGKLIDPDSEDQIFARMTLGDLSRLMVTGWRKCRGVFRPDNELGFALDKSAFQTRIKLVRDARNEVFHSNPIRNRTKVFAAAEVLLDALDIHLGDFDADLKSSTYVRAPAATSRTDRHRIPARELPRIKPLG
ncbi:hypothetical protein R3X27_05740 [Tropicimonas sp. TH_r6]|uniref:hypothetical protein n=1 Tax=Tropicimonas sp. TH_r6 TaxID=3082085 RepID=UPI002954BB20|nr:hypothetical protein [Tropicimonas sp. TH_r6]MDV7142176.1 hypothetical protein [Tropicimonas sp. TH_r6]